MAAIKTVVGADPAAGAEFTAEVVPAGVYWILLGATVECVQGATQTPWPSIVLDDGTNVLARSLSGTTAQNASVTTQHTWGTMTLSGGGAGLASTGTLPRMLLLASYRIRSLTGGIGANTNYGGPRYTVAELSQSDRIEDWI
jgi:hypothetical protein